MEDLFSEADFEQAPCEFCNELFPFDLLIQHQSGCRPDIAHYNYGRDFEEEDDDEEEDEEDDVLSKPTTPTKQTLKVAEEISNMKKTEARPADFLDLFVKAKKSIVETVKVKIDEKQKSPTSTNLGKLMVNDESIKQKQKSPPPKDLRKLIVNEDPIMQENGVKLMAYGSSMNKNLHIESEKPSFKIPSLALLNNADQKEIDDGSNTFSDSDEGESLEEFWKRAEIKNSQRLRKINSVKTVAF